MRKSLRLFETTRHTYKLCAVIMTATAVTLTSSAQVSPPPLPDPGGGPVVPPPIPNPGDPPIVPPLPGPGTPSPGDDSDPFSGIKIPDGAEVIMTPGVLKITTRSNSGGPVLAEAPEVHLEPKVFTIETPVGEIPISIRPAGPNVAPRPAAVSPPPEFRPPSFFSAPLPAGSGARALGFAGTFAAVSDDATAASWNPAGLTHLERPEVSAVFRSSHTKNSHHSTDPDFQVGSDDYESTGLNYLTAAYPFFMKGLDRNAVISLNYQEAYDFTHSFHARTTDRSHDEYRAGNSATFTETQTDLFYFESATIELEVISEITTRSSSTLNQVVETALESDLQFEQEGVIAAVSPAFAMDITPRFAVGAAFNIYQNSPFNGQTMQSRTVADYVASSESTARITQQRTTSGTYESQGVVHVPDTVTGGFDYELPDESGTYPTFTDHSVQTDRDAYRVRGTYEEISEFNDVEGFNANLGFLWTATEHLTLGGSLDLPWTAEMRQRKTVRTRTDTYDGSGTRLLQSEATEQIDEGDAEFEFPLFWTLGLSARLPGPWWPRLRFGADTGQTLWSDFSFTAEGEDPINPLDGTPHGEHPVDDTWFARTGVEYLWVLSRTEIPFRLGLTWEQRPAIGEPDDYYGFSLGSGFSVGQDPGKLIIDIAYSYLTAEGVQSVVPDQEGLETDTQQHQVFVSGIYHF